MLNRLAAILAALYAIDRILKLVAVAHFFHRAPPVAPDVWPSVTMIQPVTRADHDLRAALHSRARLDYPAPQQHMLVCDAADTDTQSIVRELIAAHPGWNARLVVAEPDGGALASKIAKIETALPHATGDVLVFVDDDISLRPDSLRVLVPYLFLPSAGAAFGLACYTNWSNMPSALMSGFVNANALPSYIPLTFLAEPFTITGHCFALRRTVWDAAGGFAGMNARFDDDHELARRVRTLGLQNIQTPLIYDVDNRIDTFAGYRAQLKRWFAMPRQAMLPFLTRREQVVSGLGSVGNLLPPLLFVLALLARSRAAWRAFLAALACFASGNAWCERVYLRRITPLRRWPLLLFTALCTPLEVLAAFASDNTIEWRGQRLRLVRGGSFEVLE